MPLTRDWDSRQYPEMTEAPSREEMLAQEQAREKTRAGIGLAINPFSSMFFDPEPSDLGTTGGMIGSIAASLAPQAKVLAPVVKAISKIPKAAPFAPSLAGTAYGTVLGVGVEQLAKPDSKLFSTETGKKLAGSLIQNALFDVGGNLVFSVGGATYNFSKNTLEKLGLKKSIFEGEGAAARLLAQEILSKHGGTLTRGQLTDSGTVKGVESLLESSTATDIMNARSNSFFKAINGEAVDILKSLDVSPDFKTALRVGDPTQMTVGKRWQSVVGTAENELKETVKPVYREMREQADGFMVDMKPLKTMAQLEWNRLAKGKFAGAGAEKKKVLEQIIKQDDVVDFETAHDLRSGWSAAARESVIDGVPNTTLRGQYEMASKAISKQMDRIAVITFGNEEQKALARNLGLKGGIDSPAGLRTGEYRADGIEKLADLNLPFTEANFGNNPMLRKYFNTQKAYKEGMQGLYSDTMSAAMKLSPSDVGGYLLNMKYPERLFDVHKALVQADKYAKGASKGLRQELQYGYLDQMFKSTDDLVGFAQKYAEDKEFAKTFNFLFPEGEERKKVTNLLKTVQIGLPESAKGSILRNRVVGSVAGLATGTAAYFALSEDAREHIDLGNLGLQAGVLIITPRLIAKAVTNKNAMDALVGIANSQKNPKFAGSILAQNLQVLQKEGILNSEYIKEVDKILYGDPDKGEAAPDTFSFSPLYRDWNSRDYSK